MKTIITKCFVFYSTTFFSLVSMNYQTKDDKMETYLGKFRPNGNCGYILKPREQRCMPNSKVEFATDDDKLLRLQIISCQHISSM